MKGTDILLIGGLGIGAYLLLSKKSTEPAASGSAGGGFSLGGISLPGISIGGTSQGGGDAGGGIMSQIIDLFGKSIDKVGGGGGGGGGSIIDDLTGGDKDIFDIDALVKKVIEGLGLEKFYEEIIAAKDAYGKGKDAYDAAKAALATTGEIPNKAKEAWDKLIDAINPGESPTPKDQAGPNSEFDIYSWFSRHKNPYADTKNIEAPKTVEPVKASYQWGWDWLPDFVNTWMGQIAWQNRAANIKGFFPSEVEYSPAIEKQFGWGKGYDVTNPYQRNLSELMAAERENYVVSQIGPRPGTPELGGEWLNYGPGWQYYIPGF